MYVLLLARCLLGVVQHDRAAPDLLFFSFAPSLQQLAIIVITAFITVLQEFAETWEREKEKPLTNIINNSFCAEQQPQG